MSQLSFQRARSDDKKRQRAAALVEAARSLALESGVASVTLTDVASRAGVHYSAVRRYFTSHKEVLLNLAAEGWARFSDTVCESLGEPGPMSPARVAEALAKGLAADPLFCDLLANLHLHLEHEVALERVLEFKEVSNAAVLSLTDAIENALPGTGTFRRVRRPTRLLLAGSPDVADGEPAEKVGRRVCEADGRATRLEDRFHRRAHAADHRDMRRPTSRVRSGLNA